MFWSIYRHLFLSCWLLELQAWDMRQKENAGNDQHVFLGLKAPKLTLPPSLHLSQSWVCPVVPDSLCSDSRLLWRSAYSAPSGPGDLPFPGTHRRRQGDAPADKRWGRHSAPSSEEKKKSCRLAGSQGSPRETDREGGSPVPSAQAISRVLLDAHLRQHTVSIS